MDKVMLVGNAYKKDKVLPIEPGDTVKLWVKIVEGDRERQQAFEGVVISIRGKGVNTTIKVRKISYGVGVERTFFLHSPRLAKIEILRKAKVRRSKLYFLRTKIGKKGRLIQRLGVKIPKESDFEVEEEPIVNDAVESVNEVEEVQEAQNTDTNTEETK